MDYHRIYRSITSVPDIEGYTEAHHIVPRCLGGTNESENIIRLSARKHFIAHLLLARMYPDTGLVHAAHMMSSMKRYNSKDYSWLREKHASSMRHKFAGKPQPMTEAKLAAYASKERGEKISKALTGKKRTQRHRENLSKARLGKLHTQEHKDKISASVSGDKNPMYGKTHSEKSIEAIKHANKVQVDCPHCSKTGAIAAMRRWHFDNCKTRKTNHVYSNQ